MIGKCPRPPPCATIPKSVCEGSVGSRCPKSVSQVNVQSQCFRSRCLGFRSRTARLLLCLGRDSLGGLPKQPLFQTPPPSVGSLGPCPKGAFGNIFGSIMSKVLWSSTIVPGMALGLGCHFGGGAVLRLCTQNHTVPSLCWAISFRTEAHNIPDVLFGLQGAYRALCTRCAKSWLFSTTGSSVSSED